jgi:vanillate O-demethylase monooxygenase subunit
LTANPNIALSPRNSLEAAFHEDLAIGADAALTYFRSVLARRIEAEGNTAQAA